MGAKHCGCPPDRALDDRCVEFERVLEREVDELEIASRPILVSLPLELPEGGPALQELLVDFITSLDGYAAAEGWPGWWGLQGPEYLAWRGEAPERDYPVVMGATTYRLMSRFAEEGEPGTDALTGMPKVVFSSTLSEPLSWRTRNSCLQMRLKPCKR
jgi:hypothetical protein